jgi:hypothetical protein
MRSRVEARIEFPSFDIDFGNRFAKWHFLLCDVADFSVLVFKNLNDLALTDKAGVTGLSSALRIKRGAVQRDRKSPVFARNAFQDGDFGFKGFVSQK